MNVEIINALVNATCNVLIFFSMLMFIIFCFGRSDSKIYKYGDLQAFILKLGLTTICLGSLVNLISLSNPPFSEIVLNIGFALLFCWAAVFHYIVFVLKKKDNYTVKKNSAKIKSSKLIGSTWILSLISQIVNTVLIGYLLSECKSLNLISSSVLAVSFTVIQSWSFYAIFKTMKLRFEQNVKS